MAIAVLSLALGGLVVFLAGSAFYKVRHFADHKDAVESYRLTPQSLSGLAAGALLAWEGATALLAVAAPSLASIAFASAAGLLTVYAAAMAINLMRGRRTLDCGCHWGVASGAGSSTISWAHVGRLGAAAVVLCSLASAATVGLTYAQAALGVFWAVPFAMLWTAGAALRRNAAALAGRAA